MDRRVTRGFVGVIGSGLVDKEDDGLLKSRDPCMRGIGNDLDSVEDRGLALQ